MEIKHPTSKTNFSRVSLEIFGDKIIVWFSYDTLIAFETRNILVVSENIWGQTTGRHISYIKNWSTYGREYTVLRDDFETLFGKVIGGQDIEDFVNLAGDKYKEKKRKKTRLRKSPFAL